MRFKDKIQVLELHKTNFGIEFRFRKIRPIFSESFKNCFSNLNYR